MHRLIKCPDCLEVVVLQKWLDEHECQKERSEDYNCREKLLMFLCIASILIAVVTGCILAYSKTPLSLTHPCGDLVMSNKQLQEKIAQLEEVAETLKARESELNAIKKEHGELKCTYESIASEKNKLQYCLDSEKQNCVQLKKEMEEKQSKIDSITKELRKKETDFTDFKNKNEKLILKIKEIESEKKLLEEKATENKKAVNKIQTSENNKANNRSAVVGSKEFQASSSNETSTTDIKKWESVNKTLATEMNKTDQSEIAGYDIPETSAANETDTAETDESEPLPQPVLMVTEVGSTYLEVAWVLPEKSKTNAAHIHYIVHFRKYGAQWQEVSFLNASRTSYSLTNLNPGMSYQIYVMAVDSRFSRPGEIATVRTSDKFVNHSPSKGHGKQLLVYAATIIILVIAIAGVYNYSKTSFSALHPYGEEVKEVSTAELNKADTLEVSLSNETKASGSNQTGIAKTENLVSSINVPEERDWMTDVRDFLIEGAGVDVTFELATPNGKVEFFAHQLILALRSPYFADEFYGKGKNNGHLRISLKGIDPKAFKEILRYCYDNKPRLRTTEDACVLFKLASDFKMLNLQKLCRTFIRDAEIDS